MEPPASSRRTTASRDTRALWPDCLFWSHLEDRLRSRYGRSSLNTGRIASGQSLRTVARQTMGQARNRSERFAANVLFCRWG